jgi:hypothetical protein
MRKSVGLAWLTGTGAVALIVACVSDGSTNVFTSDDSGSSDGSSRDEASAMPPTDSGAGVDGLAEAAAADAGPPPANLIYANTDTSLYILDPTTHVTTLFGAFSLPPPYAESGAPSVTDCAIDLEGDVYVCTETDLFRATVPTSPGPVTLTHLVTFGSSVFFYALAFVPAGILGPGEQLIGGDNTGELWAIDVGSGAVHDLGSFGPDPAAAGQVFSLSGDMVFYLDAQKQPQGVATIRSCLGSMKSTCNKANDYLAALDMPALKIAFSSGTPASSLLLGIYGGADAGIGTGELFGLAASGGIPYAFARAQLDASASVLTVDATGRGTTVATQPTIITGWSGACVSTTATITLGLPK